MSAYNASTTDNTHPLDPVSEWRAWQVLSIFYTVLVNHQLRRRWDFEQKLMKHQPLSEQFRPILLIETVPSLSKPRVASVKDTFNEETLSDLKARVGLLHARIEKGKELASEIERRMQNPRAYHPTHFCHTCIQDSTEVEIKLTKCGHRVCQTCIPFGVGASEVYECSICFAPAEFLDIQHSIIH